MDKTFQYPLQEIQHSVNFHTFQFSYLGASTQLGCTAVTSNFRDKIIISPCKNIMSI